MMTVSVTVNLPVLSMAVTVSASLTVRSPHSVVPLDLIFACIFFVFPALLACFVDWPTDV